MKKICLLTVLILSMSIGAKAQELHFGIKGGLNFATVGGDDTEDLKMRTAFHLGALMEVRFSEVFAIQPEVLYSAQGTSGEEDGLDVDIKMDYINVPIMAKYNFSEKFSVEAGPQIGFLVSTKAKTDGVEVDLDEYDLFNDFDFGLAVGLSYKIMPNLFVSGRYNLGLSNINNDSGDFESEGSNQNNVIQLSIGYMF
ncbi:porin family protein [Aegicerativicinus sediminis]|uniref:porin family protein n=1 Tax=Aegicerativicinus sediminis TaxID=2893202 RepID=UPI001E3CFCAE|nr:porin family protein [Aegicerativicinus sediminis]